MGFEGVDMIETQVATLCQFKAGYIDNIEVAKTALEFVYVLKQLPLSNITKITCFS